jgi:hypothetical protein
MKSTKVLVSALLIPALLVASGEGASDSVQKLLRKPRYGLARITLTDGTQAQGIVSRVTSQFVTLRERNTCRNVKLAAIASVKRVPGQGDSPEDTLGWLVFGVIASPILVPVYIAYLLEDRNDSPLNGSWETTTTLPGGKISRIEGNGNGLGQRSLAVEKGRYEVIAQDLHLAYDGSGLVETIPIQFECDSLLLGSQELSAQVSTHSAQAPIVGRWHPNTGRRGSWEFTASGTFEKRVAESEIQGQIEKIKGGVRVRWLGPDAKPDEAWSIRTKGHHLFITVGGGTTEYVRAAE